MKAIADMAGVAILTALYMVTAWIISFGLGINTDRALLVVIVIVVAQIRWHMKDESPVGKPDELPPTGR